MKNKYTTIVIVCLVIAVMVYLLCCAVLFAPVWVSKVVCVFIVMCVSGWYMVDWINKYINSNDNDNND